MCSSKSNYKPNLTTTKVAQINGRPVLQPTSNQVSNLERRNSLKKTTSPKSPTLKPAPLPLPTSTATNTASNFKTKSSLSPPISPKLKSPRPPAVKRGNDPNELNSSAEKVMTPRCTTTKLANWVKKPKSTTSSNGGAAAVLMPSYDTTALIVDAPGSIAAARREQVAIMQEQRKMRIAHYGRTKSAKFEGKVNGLDYSDTGAVVGKEKRCSFITPNSDPTYVSYHDEEWGVPVHDDKLLLELLVLTAAQVGSDWTSVLKKRQEFRVVFSGFDPEVIAKFSEKKITSICTEYGLDISQVRGVVDNSIRILEVKKAFGSFDKYLWGFVNHKPITTQYRLCNKIPVKTSKSETISKDMVRRGFRYVGPTVIHSFMQAAGLTNDHLVTCPRHSSA